MLVSKFASQRIILGAHWAKPLSSLFTNFVTCPLIHCCANWYISI